MKVRGMIVAPVYDTNGNIVMTKELFDWLMKELDESIPIEWIQKYNFDEDRGYKSIRIKKMLDDWNDYIGRNKRIS